MEENERKTFKRDRYFLNYKILHLIGQGGFSDIYFVKEKKNNRRYALKVERKNPSRSMLTSEAKILRRIQESLLFPRYKEFGETTNYYYLVTECLGPSLTSVRKILPDLKFSFSTGLRLGIEMLRCISDIHQLGYIHRDIKPTNFLVRASRANPIALIDFGLTRKHINKETLLPFPPREKVGFVGTPKYASLNAHECRDLSRRDDIISWWYSLIEMLNGSLPWGELSDKKEIYRMKLNADYDQICSELPKEILGIRRCILQLGYDSEPPYNLYVSFLVAAMIKTKATFDDQFDWENLIAREKEHLSSVPFDPPDDEEPTIPTNLVPPVVPGENEYEEEEEKNEKHNCCLIM